MKKLISTAVFAAFICCLQAGFAQAAPWCDASDWAVADAKCKDAGLGCASAGDDGCPNYSGGAIHCHGGALVTGGAHPRTDAKTDKAIRSDLVGKFSAKSAKAAAGAVAKKNVIGGASKSADRVAGSGAAPKAVVAPAGGRAAAAPRAIKHGGLTAGKVYQHTTSQGTACCAPCNEIASDGSCKSWGQCSGATNCDAWTN